MADKVFMFDSSKGAGVPGLPHEVSESQAASLGMLDVLKQAVQNGLYTEKQAVKNIKAPTKDTQE